MDEKNDYDYEELHERADLGFELIIKILNSLDLLIAMDKNTSEIILADRNQYLQYGNKKGVATEIGSLNAVIFESEEDIPDYIRENHMDKVKILKKEKVDK